MLSDYIAVRTRQKPILLMTHIVIGYPTLDDSLRLVETMVGAGVDLIELQLPFSEPIADGPVIARANHAAITGGITVDQCFSFAEKVAGQFDIPFLFMSYYNLLHCQGPRKFVERMSSVGLQGAIVADLPLEEAGEFLLATQQQHIDPIFIFSPRTTAERMSKIADHARGFVYCVARTGVTGQATRFGDGLTEYLKRCRAATSLPLALGFGVRERSDIQYLTGKVDIAVIGSETLRIVDAHGVSAVGDFLKSLRN